MALVPTGDRRDDLLMMLVRDVMTTDVVTAGVDTPLATVIELMLRHGVSGLPVIDDARRVVGVVTEADLVARRGHDRAPRRLLTIVDEVLHEHHNRWRQKASGLITGEVMTVPAHTIGPSDTVRHAAARMVTMAVKRLPVVDADGRLIGIIAQRDVLRLMHRADSEIDLAVRAALDQLGAGAAVDAVAATTTNGIVTLTGSAATVGDVERIVQRIGELPGVLDVRNLLRAVRPGPVLDTSSSVERAGGDRPSAGAANGTDGPTGGESPAR
jgi:CBS domain-containing protein